MKVQRSLARRLVREEMNLGNVQLMPGGIRKNLPQLEVCIASFSSTLCRQGYIMYAEVVNDVVKQALMSILKTEGRKSEDKAAAYNLMIERGKVRVQRWRLRERMLSIYAGDQAAREVARDVRATHEEVRFVMFFSVSTSCVRQALQVDYMPFVAVEDKGTYKLTPLSWLSEAAKKVQFTAVTLLNDRAKCKFRDQYELRYGLLSMPLLSYCFVAFSWVDDTYDDFKPPPDVSKWALLESWVQGQAEKLDYEEEEDE